MPYSAPPVRTVISNSCPTQKIQTISAIPGASYIYNDVGMLIGYMMSPKTSVSSNTPQTSCVQTPSTLKALSNQSNINNTASLPVSEVTTKTLNSNFQLPVIDRISSIALNNMPLYPRASSIGSAITLPQEPVTFVGSTHSASSTTVSQSTISSNPISSTLLANNQPRRPVISQVSAASNTNPSLAKVMSNIENLLSSAHQSSPVPHLSSRPAPMARDLMPVINSSGLANASHQSPVTFVSSILSGVTVQAKPSTVVPNSSSSQPALFQTPSISVMNSFPLPPAAINATTQNQAYTFSSPLSSVVLPNKEPSLPVISEVSSLGLYYLNNIPFDKSKSNIRLPDTIVQMLNTSVSSNVKATTVITSPYKATTRQVSSAPQLSSLSNNSSTSTSSQIISSNISDYRTNLVEEDFDFMYPDLFPGNFCLFVKILYEKYTNLWPLLKKY